MSRPSPRSREEGLRRLYRVTAWVAAAAVAATGVVAAAAAQALPGRSSPTPASTGQDQPGTSTTAPGVVTPSDPSASSGELQPPVQAPTPTGRSHHVVSGGT